MKYLISILAGTMLVSSAHASVVIYDGSLDAAITANNGAATYNYDPAAAYAMYGYNPVNITYSEAVTGMFGGSDKEIKIVKNNGGLDGALRYNFTPSAVQSFANGTPSAEDFLNDVSANPTLSFDIIYTGGASWGSVRVDINSNSGDAPAVVLLDEGLALGVAEHITVDLSAGSIFQTWVSQMGSATDLGSFAQLRIEVQTASDDPAGGTFYIDNIQIVPEPATVGLLGFGIFAAGLIRRWTQI
jgi:hypothetical protein